MTERIKIVSQPPNRKLIDVLNELDGYATITQDENGKWILESTVEFETYSVFGGLEWRGIRTRTPQDTTVDAMDRFANGISGQRLRCGKIFRRKYLDLTNTRVDA